MSLEGKEPEHVGPSRWARLRCSSFYTCWRATGETGERRKERRGEGRRRARETHTEKCVPVCVCVCVCVCGNGHRYLSFEKIILR